MSTLSQLYEKSVKKVSGVYIQTKQNSLKFLNALNINIANKLNENSEIERKSKNNDLENYNKESKCLDYKPAFFKPLTPYPIESYHKFISDTSTPYYNHDDYYNNEDDEVSNINSPNSAYSTNSFSFKSFDYSHHSLTKSPYSRESPCSINEKDLSDQESSDDQEDYFSRQRSNYSSHSSSSSVSSTNYAINELALTPLSNDKDDEGYEIIYKEDAKYIESEKPDVKYFEREKTKEKSRKSTMKSISSQKSDRSIRSIKPRKSMNKLSLRLNKKKSSSSTTTTDTTGTTNFEEFISSMDTSEDIEDKLQWLFSFFDQDRDGFLTSEEMLQLMDTLYN